MNQKVCWSAGRFLAGAKNTSQLANAGFLCRALREEVSQQGMSWIDRWI
jgi:hypothetical protein